MTVFFESEPVEYDNDDTSLVYQYGDKDQLNLEVSFGIVLNAISVEISFKQNSIVKFSTESVKKIALVEKSNRLIIVHIESACVKGEVWIHLEPNIYLKTFLFDR